MVGMGRSSSVYGKERALMREILGRWRRVTWPLGSLKAMGLRRKDDRERSALRAAALTCAHEWNWPVLPGIGHDSRRPDVAADGVRTQACACPQPDCAVPGAHPFDPGLLAATTDGRMVDWWWTRRPDAPLLLATGGPVSAVSLPASVGMCAVQALERMGVRLGPVVSTPTRCVLLVAPYSLEELGELLARHDWVPSSLRYHGHGGYVVLPPSRTGTGGVWWEREPRPGAENAAPWLPDIRVIVDMLVEVGVSAPDGTRLAY